MAAARPAALARPAGRWVAALAGLLAAAAAAAAYTRIGALGLSVAPAVALLLASVAAFAVAGGRRAAAGRHPLALALPSLAFYGAFFLVPMGFLVLFAVSTNLGQGRVEYGFSLDNLDAALDGLYIDAFTRTLRVAAVGTALTALAGFPLAYWLARYAPARHRTLLLALVVVPFWTSFLIRTYSFLIVLSPSFALSDALQSLGLIDGPLDVLNTTAAVQIGLVYNYLPLFVLPVYAALERMDWRLVEAAQDLGAGGSRAFRQITLRLTAPGVAAGALLVFIPMMGEYIVPLILGGGRIDLVGNVIGRAFLDQQDYPFGAALALLAMGALSLVLAGYALLSRRAEEAHGA